MTWLLLTAPVQLPGQKEQIVKRRVNFSNALIYEPNADGGTSLIMVGVGGILQVTESPAQIDAALSEVAHPLRVEEQVENQRKEIVNSGMTYSQWADAFAVLKL